MSDAPKRASRRPFAIDWFTDAVGFGDAFARGPEGSWLEYVVGKTVWWAFKGFDGTLPFDNQDEVTAISLIQHGVNSYHQLWPTSFLRDECGGYPGWTPSVP